MTILGDRQSALFDTLCKLCQQTPTLLSMGETKRLPSLGNFPQLDGGIKFLQAAHKVRGADRIAPTH